MDPTLLKTHLRGIGRLGRDRSTARLASPSAVGISCVNRFMEASASSFFSFLSGMCFVAILPTVLMSVLVLHPEAVEIAGLTWHPLLLAVVAFGGGKFLCLRYYTGPKVSG